VLGNRRASAPQVPHAPAPRVVEIAPLIERHAGAVRDVRLELLGSVGQHVEQLGPDVVGRRLDRLEPGKQAAVVELDGGISGK